MTITNVKVKLLGEDGNGFYIIGKVKKELLKAGYDKEFIQGFLKDATSGDYDTLLETVMAYVEVE